MNVQCEQCGVGYSLDDTLIGAAGTAVRCTNCGHVFRVLRKAATVQDDSWVLRHEDGSTSALSGLGTLQQLIAAGRASENDLLSRAGVGDWKRLGDFPEMRGFFPSARDQNANAAVAAGWVRTEPSRHQATIKAEPLPVGTNRDETPARMNQPRASVPMAKPVGGPAQPQPWAPAANRIGAVPATKGPVVAVAPVAVASPGPAEMPASSSTIPNADVRYLATIPAAQGVTVSSSQNPAMMRTMPAMPNAIPTPTPTTSPIITPTATVTPVAQPATAASPPAARHQEPDLSQVPAVHEERPWQTGTAIETRGPAWTEKSGSPHPIGDDIDLDQVLPRSGNRIWRVIIPVVLAAAAGVGAWLYFFKTDEVTRQIDTVLAQKDENRHEGFWLKGRESFLLDTKAAFRQADREFQKVLGQKESHAPTLAALAEMYSVWAQYLLDEELDARVDAKTQTVEGREPDYKDAEKLSVERLDLLAEAARFAEQALAADPKLAAAQRAMADVRRLEGKVTVAREWVVRAKAAQPDDGETIYVEALVDADSGKPPADVAGTLSSLNTRTPLLRALYREARIRAVNGERDEAKVILSRLFELNAGHEWGRALQRRIEAGQSLLLSLNNAPGVTTAASDTDSLAAPVGGTPALPAADAAPSVATADPGAGGGEATRAAPEDAAPAMTGSVDTLLTRGARAKEAGRNAEAIAAFEKVLSSQPSNIDALCGAGEAYLDSGNTGQAITYFRRAIGVNPSYAPAVFGLATAFKAQGQKDQALKYFERYLEVSPNGRQASAARANIEKLKQEPVGEPTSPAPAEDKPAATPPGPDLPAPSSTREAPPADKPAVGTEPSGTPAP